MPGVNIWAGVVFFFFFSESVFFSCWNLRQWLDIFEPSNAHARLCDPAIHSYSSGHLIHIALSPAHLACSAVKDERERERAVSYKVYKVEDEDKYLRLSSVCCGLYTSSLTHMSVCVHTQRLKRQNLIIRSFSVLQKHFLLLVDVVTVLKNFKVHLTFPADVFKC